MKLPTSLLAVSLSVAGCAASDPMPAAPQPLDDLTHASLGRTVVVGGPKVTPLAIVEDSRCPMNARCVWAGRVRIQVRIDLGRGSETRELVQGTPVPVADGILELVEVQPDKPRASKGALSPNAYRFGFRFMGGL